MTTTSPSLSPSPSPSPSPSWTPNSLSKPPVCFSPPLIAMVVIIATAFILITYSRAISRRLILLRSRWRQWRRRRRLLRSYDIESPANSGEQPYDPNYNHNHNYSYGYQLFSMDGLDDAAIKTIPLSIHTRKGGFNECAVCLVEFEDDDYVRTLPVCFHAFHVECIDIWLKCHANCPLCRSSVFRSDSPFIPVMSARIRPNFDDVVLDPSPEPIHSRQRHSITGISDITNDVSVSPTRNQFDDRFKRRDFLKRSYSFGFERNVGSSVASPWRHSRGGSFWCKRPSPFSLSKTRVFSFRYSRRMKSPFFRRRSISFLPVLESGGGGSGSSSSRRRINSSMFSSSRLRSGDPEALLSPERYNRR